eukprot:2183973-Amphidinium_carterae.2
MSSWYLLIMESMNRVLISTYSLMGITLLVVRAVLPPLIWNMWSSSRRVNHIVCRRFAQYVEDSPMNCAVERLDQIVEVSTTVTTAVSVTTSIM